jgi:hypothetical protein
MKSEKTEMIGLRLSKRYKDFLEKMAAQKRETVQEFLTDMIRKEMKAHISNYTFFNAIEQVSNEFGIPASTGYALNSGDRLYVADKLEEGIITLDTLDKFRERVKTVFSENIEKNKKEFSYGDDIDEMRDEVLDEK